MVLSVKDMRDLGEFLFTWICAIDRELSLELLISAYPPAAQPHKASREGDEADDDDECCVDATTQATAGAGGGATSKPFQ